MINPLRPISPVGCVDGVQYPLSRPGPEGFRPSGSQSLAAHSLQTLQHADSPT